ncbi:PAS domain S-box protein [Coraliomargarita algicola]|uniref:histidine kinase n=1 Tax=Coraliomargarita algicola TaxID=3092156 RepID=A0ABZ0RHY6_9BACT|nr:PAS domain S-box protein [Coraliomargarita sp. J2-16]WPJ94869.1 PAS domain S-box protein [Coraliomargarita sp. J2-16]
MKQNEKRLLIALTLFAVICMIGSAFMEYLIMEKIHHTEHGGMSQFFHIGNLVSTALLFACLTYYWVKRSKDKTLQATELQRENLRITLNSIGDAIISTDATGFISQMNPVAEKMTGWSLSEASGKPLASIFNIFKANTGERVENPVQKVLESGAVVELANHTSLIAKDGTVRQIADSAAPIRDAQNKIQGVVLVFRDVSDEYAIRSAMEAEQTRNRNILKGTNAGTWDWNIRTGESIVNSRWVEIIGYTLAELGPIDTATWTKTGHPDDLPFCEKALNDHLKGKTDYYDAEFRQLHKDGKWRWIHARGSIVARDKNGSPIHMSGTHMDVTERIENALALKESKEILHNVVNNIPARVFWKNRDSIYMGCNQQFAEDAGMASAEELIGKDDFAASWGAHQANLFRMDDREVMESGQAKLLYQEPQTRNGEETWVETSKIPLKDSDGQIIGVLGTYVDITSRREAEKALIRAKDDAEAASHAKDEFLAVMSHEMRTPLNPIIGFSELLLESITQDPENSQLRTIHSAGNRQLQLIDDILDFMRIDRGSVQASPEAFSIYELCQAALADAKFVAHGLDLQLQNGATGIAIEEQLLVETDLTMLQRILDNLLNNACKYTRKGSITLSISRCPQATDRFIFQIKDTGIGIDEEVLQHIFKPFSQADSSYTRKHEGAGLGLAICQKLVKLLNGSIHVESKYNKAAALLSSSP